MGAGAVTDINYSTEQEEVDDGEFSCWLEIFPLCWPLLHVELRVEIFEI